LAPLPAPVAQRPRAGAPIPARGAPDVSGRTARAKFPGEREPRIPRPASTARHSCMLTGSNRHPATTPLATPHTGRRARAHQRTKEHSSWSQGFQAAPRPPLHLATRATPNWCAAPHATAVAVLCCCTLGSGFRIISLTCGAKGTRTPGLLHAISRQHVHPRLSPQVTVPQRPPATARVPARCGTFLLYSPASPQQPSYVAGLSRCTPPGSRHLLAEVSELIQGQQRHPRCPGPAWRPLD
jgi:hypothetical protein